MAKKTTGADKGSKSKKAAPKGKSGKVLSDADLAQVSGGGDGSVRPQPTTQQQQQQKVVPGANSSIKFWRQG